MYDVRKPKAERNQTTPLSALKSHFVSPDREGLNCLDIRNVFALGAPVQIHRVDALRLALYDKAKNPFKATYLL
ncbi:hypothetical protein LTR66_015616 [Elasticomyces elasticus]|nr:hypothetical protein LTR66_015616 [Elasticomyces elasticus]